MRKITILACLLMIMANTTFAQTRPIQGTVRDNNSKPLEAVTILVEGTQNSTLSDANGKFSIQAGTGQMLRFSYLGAQPVNFKIVNADNLQIKFSDYVTKLDEVVVTGYQRERKKDITGAVAVVNLKDVKDIPVGNPVKALQGRIPGVMITTDGSPGGGATVRIRGIGTLGNNDPLYIIDGIPTKRGLQELNQNDIESIQVLKDASSATIYGSRAANGVIIVTTKKGKKGYNRVDFDASTSLQFYNSKIDVLNTEQRGRAYWQASVNDRLNPNVNQTYQYDWNNDFNNPVLNKVILPEFLDAIKSMRPADTHWFDEVSQTSVLQNYNLSLASGTERGNSLFSISYYDNKGIIRQTRDQKLTARFNSDYSFFKNRVKIGENFSATYLKDVLIPTGSVTELSIIAIPAVPIHTVDGGWGGPGPGMADRHNPVRLIEDNKQNKNKFVRVFGNAFIEVNILPKLNFRSSIGVDYNGNYARTLRKSYVSGYLSDQTNAVNNSSSYEGNWILQNTLTYNFATPKSKFDFLAGHEQVKYATDRFSANRQGLALENTDYAYLGAASSNTDVGGSGTGNALLSYFGKVNYSFNDKYLASATVRRDGSSRFGAENRYGIFPAFSLGWRVSEENFIKQNAPYISDLKLRYSYGQTGNQEIGDYGPYTTYASIYGIYHIFWAETGSAYDLNGAGGGQLPSGFTRTQRGNSSLKWESTSQSNFGVDFGLLNNKLSGSVDYFIKNTSDIIIAPPYLAVLGEGATQFVNGASMKNTGLEILLSYEGKISNKFSYNLTGNFSSYRNKVTELPSDLLTAYPGNGIDKTILGRSINSIYGYIADGLFTTQDQVDKSAAQPGKGLGRIRYKDLDGNGIINNQDQNFIGTIDPDFIYGLNTSVQYKDLSVSFFFQGIKGIKAYNNYKNLTDFSSIQPGANWGLRTLDAWTPKNNNSTIPALTITDRNNENRTSTYFVESGSYLKLRNIQVGYNLKKLFGNSNIQNARIYLQGSNLFTVKSKSFTAKDPENPNNQYPIPVIATVGINFTF